MAKEEKCVLGLDLKIEIEGALVMSGSNWFHKLEQQLKMLCHLLI